MPTSQARYLFLPWLRQGLTAAPNVPDPLDPNIPARLTMRVRLLVNDSEAAVMPIDFYGPGDVLGIDPREIVRTEPRPRLTNFEPNLFPFIEFDRPDFPWMFTPAKADSQGRLRPWLSLVVLPRGESVRLEVNPRRPLPVLDCPLSELPELSDSWAWAHSQISSGSGATNSIVNDILHHNPERSASRLLCPRRLESGVAYLACLVPAFDVGRKAGLGEQITAVDETHLLPAWPSPASADPETRIQLPVYFHWEFVAGLAGDFEALVRRLQVRLLPAKVGVQRVAVNAPGWGIPPQPIDAPGSILELGGVLKTPTAVIAPWPSASSGEFRGRLRDILNSPPESGGGPVVKPPLYGQEYAQSVAVPEEGAPPHWLRELNLDPRYRLAAGLGTMVIRYEQERLMASAWSQLAAAERDIQAQRRAEFGVAVNTALAAKHLPALSAPAETAAAPSAFAPQAMAMAPAAVSRPAAPALISHTHGSLARRLEVRGLIAPIGDGRASAPLAMAYRAASEEQPPAPPGPFSFVPTFPRPMVEMMRDYFPHLLLPNLTQVPPNTIALLETNPAFVEAYMVGLNHEMGRELLWREFPVDRRGTFFQNFWSDSANSQSPNDLPPIAGWSPESRLGDHLQQGSSGSGGADPALEAQISAAQAQVETFNQQITELETAVASQTAERDAAYLAGEPTRQLLDHLRLQNALIETREFELGVNQAAVTGWEAAAVAAEQAAIEAYDSVNPQRAELAELQVIAEQVPPLEANLQSILDEIAGVTADIEASQALLIQLPLDIEAAEATGQAARQHLSDVQAQVATIPDLQTQAEAADQEAAGYQAQAQEAQASAAAIRATVEPAHRRLDELYALQEDQARYKDRTIELPFEIEQLEFAIAEHRANQPPAPPEEEPKENLAIGEPDIGFPGDPYEDYYEWLRQLQEMEAQLAALNDELAYLLQLMDEIDVQLQEIPALQAEIEAAEQQAAPYDAAAVAALQAAAAATNQANSLRSQITALEQLATTIPSIEAEIRAADELVISLTAQLEALPGQIAALEASRTEAEGRAVEAQAALDAVLTQLVEMPRLEAEIAAAEALSAEYTAQAAAAWQEKTEAEARIAALELEIADLEAEVASIPAVEADLQAINEALQEMADAIEAVQTQLTTAVAACDTAQTTVWQLLTERTLRCSSLVLLIRGDLLRRFSRATIYAVEAEWADEGHTQRRLGSNELYPIFRESWGSDITFLGFTLTGQEARGHEGHPGWYFVIQEQPTEPRFGLDASTGSARPVEDIAAWDSLSWDDLIAEPDSLPSLVYIPVDGRLNNQERPVSSANATPAAIWGRTSAHMAIITQQKPARMAVHAGVWLPPALSGGQ